MYESEVEIEQVVRGFETCATPAAEFHHREHLTVAVWYLQTLSREKTVETMRSALMRFIEHHGVDPKKYSEEITVFCVDAIAGELQKIGTQASLVEKCNQVIAALNSQRKLSLPARTPASPVAAAE